WEPPKLKCPPRNDSPASPHHRSSVLDDHHPCTYPCHRGSDRRRLDPDHAAVTQFHRSHLSHRRRADRSRSAPLDPYVALEGAVSRLAWNRPKWCKAPESPSHWMFRSHGQSRCEVEENLSEIKAIRGLPGETCPGRGRPQSAEEEPG